MWIVQLALRRPLTFIVMALLIVLISPLTILRTPTDILPDINIPIIAIVWRYGGLSAEEMSERMVYINERTIPITVNNIDHIESQSLDGIGVIKVFFQPNVDIPTALAQVTAICQTAVRTMPPGTTPPFEIVYSASSVPIVQIGLSSSIVPEQELNDLGQNVIRPILSTINGLATPNPYGGRQRQIDVDLDTRRCSRRD